MRPAPECFTSLMSIVVEPVSRYRPWPPASSTLRLTASHIPGTHCHSSSSLGFSPSRTYPGTISAMPDLFGSFAMFSTSMWLFESCIAVVVFPHHLGPVISTAPNASMQSLRSASTQRGTYLPDIGAMNA